MSIQILQLTCLVAFIFFIFRYFFLKASPEPVVPVPIASPPKLTQKSKQQSSLSSKYAPPDQTIQQIEKQQSEENSFMQPQGGSSSQIAPQVYFEAEEISQNQLDPSNLEKNQPSSLPEESNQENEQNISEPKETLILFDQSFSQPNPKKNQDPTQHKDSSSKQAYQIVPESVNNLIKIFEVASSDFKQSQSRHDFEVKDVVSECQEMSMDDEVHSNAYRIEVSELQSKPHKKLKVVKEHYKSIIENLKRKLQEVCIRNNESFDSEINNQTVTFSEQESSFFGEDVRAELEVKVEEVATLRDELQLHEDILTNIIEQDNKLKVQLKTLEEQNNSLKTALKASSIHQPQDSRLSFNTSERRFDNIIEKTKSEDGGNSLSDFKNNYEGIEGVESRIMELYTSQMLGSTQLKKSYLSSHVFTKQSTISMMSLIEGAISISMLGECRFLNEISKKFAIGEVKKFRKQRVTNAELVYNFDEETEDCNVSLYSVLSANIDFLVLIKLESRSVAIFADSIYSQDDEQCSEQIERKILLLNLTTRKSYIRKGVCFYANNQIIFDQEEQGWLTEFPPFTFQGGECYGELVAGERVTNIAVFHLTLQSQQQ